MNYFDDLTFVNHANSEHTAAQARKRLFQGYYGIQFHYRGTVRAWTGNHPPETADTPQVFITYPGVEFNYGAPEGTVRCQAHVCFCGKRVERYRDAGLLEFRETNLFHPICDPDYFLKTMLELFRRLNIPGTVHHARAVLLLEELLLQIQDQPEVPGRAYQLYRSRFKQLQTKISTDPAASFDFRKEAARMGLSHVHFRRLFQQFTGWPPGQFHLECRLRLAEKLLVSGESRIGEIAAYCGFDDEYHFSKIFKKHRTLSPSAFRNRYGI